MLKLGREVQDRGVGKTKLKKVVYVTFSIVFSAIFLYRPIRMLDLIEINNYNLTPLNRFCNLPA